VILFETLIGKLAWIKVKKVPNPQTNADFLFFNAKIIGVNETHITFLGKFGETNMFSWDEIAQIKEERKGKA
jgi:hypothetical protein